MSKKEGSAPEPGLTHAMAFARLEFYRDSYRKAWNLIFLLAGLVGISLTLNVIQYFNRAPVQNFGLTPDLRVVEMKPVGEAIYGPSEILGWASRVVPMTYNLNFQEFKQQIADLEPNFTPQGYASYLKGLKFANIEDLIKQNRYVVSSAPKSTPRIIGTTKVDGAYAWRIEVPTMVTYSSGSAQLQQELAITILAVRVPQTRNENGVAIHSFVAKRY